MNKICGFSVELAMFWWPTIVLAIFVCRGLIGLLCSRQPRVETDPKKRLYNTLGNSLLWNSDWEYDHPRKRLSNRLGVHFQFRQGNFSYCIVHIGEKEYNLSNLLYPQDYAKIVKAATKMEAAKRLGAENLLVSRFLDK